MKKQLSTLGLFAAAIFLFASAHLANADTVVDAPNLFNPPDPTIGTIFYGPNPGKVRAYWTSGGGSTTGFWINLESIDNYTGCNGTGSTLLGNVTSHLFTGIDPNGEYYFEICAVDANGNLSGEVDEYFTAGSTPPCGPSPPGNCRISQ